MKSPIERREFGKVILSSALSAAAAAAQTQKTRPPRPWPPGIKISVQMPGDPGDEDLQFVNQLGCRYVNIPTSGKTATYENFVRLKNKVESAGLLVWNIGNSDVHNMEAGDAEPSRPRREDRGVQELHPQSGARRTALHDLRAHGQRHLEFRAGTSPAAARGPACSISQPPRDIGPARSSKGRSRTAASSARRRSGTTTSTSSSRWSRWRRSKGSTSAFIPTIRPCRCWAACRAASSEISKATSARSKSPTARTSACACAAGPGSRAVN